MPAIKMLLVDDDFEMREMIKDAFQAAPIDITTATDGLQALDQIKTGRYDIIISDINMPNLDGVELAKKIKSSKLNGNTTIVMMSSGLDKDNIGTLTKLGVKNILAKPFKINQVVDIIKNSMKKAS